ncbi:S24 family peptidase [Saccharicrinis sp. FJH62]|uniref:S24 family peptidase n=1 Tax=Saccharicrinis sp. FJH62 TaxID=3344657 RepID=UPI0035D41264
MDHFLGSNIKHLRKIRNLTQDQFADKMAVKRSLIGSYEEGRAVPKLAVLRSIALYFDVSIDNLVNRDLSLEENTDNLAHTPDIGGKGLRVLTTIVDRDNKEQITLVPVKASAGYTRGYTDPDFIETLPKFNLPLPELQNERTYRAFQIKGDSMEPIPSGAYIICEYLQNWKEIKDGRTYILLTYDDGIVYKRVYMQDNSTLLLKSDNPEYDPYTMPLNTVMEVWKALGYICFSLPEPDDTSLRKLTSMVYKMQDELEKLKKKE